MQILYDYVFKKMSAAESSESIYMRERVNKREESIMAKLKEIIVKTPEAAFLL